MKDVIATGQTYRTTDYDRFKRLEGNRAVLNTRVKKIKTNIEKHGYIFNPIVVNERFEIIDGQGRFEALRLLEFPIVFVIAPGAGLAECVALNACGTIWTLKDYIDSYCEMGDDNYVRLREIMADYKTLGTQVVLMLTMGLPSIPNETIKNGRLTLTKALDEEARKSLKIASRFQYILKRLRGTPVNYYYAIVFAVRMGANENRLLEQLEKADIKPAPNLRIAMDNVSDIYNYHIRDTKNRIYLNQIYEQTMCNKYGWYQARYGTKSQTRGNN